MKCQGLLTHEFVEFIPDILQEGTVYVSIPYTTAVHKCCCGCDREVVTPLSPTGWRLIFDGETISLDPSIGSWNLPCRSHYWIRQNQVQWVPQWFQKEVNTGRARETEAKERCFSEDKNPAMQNTFSNLEETKEDESKDSRWQRFKKWLFSLMKTGVAR